MQMQINKGMKMRPIKEASDMDTYSYILVIVKGVKLYANLSRSGFASGKVWTLSVMSVFWAL